MSFRMHATVSTRCVQMYTNSELSARIFELISPQAGVRLSYFVEGRRLISNQRPYKLVAIAQFRMKGIVAGCNCA